MKIRENLPMEVGITFLQDGVKANYQSEVSSFARLLQKL